MLHDYRYVFILAYGRTGSTLLAKMLSVHDGVSIRGENCNLAFHLMNAVAASRDMREFGPPDRPDGFDRPWFGNRAGDPNAFAAALAEGFVRHVLNPPPGARVIGFKEIRHRASAMKRETFLRYVDLLLDVFPNARILLNSRRVDDVVKSGWWRDKDPEKARRDILATDANFAAAAAGSDHVMHVWHEDTISSAPRRADMFRFLGLEPDEERIARALSTPLMHLKGGGRAGAGAESGAHSVDRQKGGE